MKPISSRDNPFYKELKQLATSAQARRKAGQSLLDGVHLAQAWLQRGIAPVYCIVAESALVHAEVNGIYGHRRIHAELMAQGLPCGRHRVARLMHKAVSGCAHASAGCLSLAVSMSCQWRRICWKDNSVRRPSTNAGFGHDVYPYW